MPAKLDVAAIRRRTDLAQSALARRIGVSPVTRGNQEQGHRPPTGPARVLLALVERNPLIVERTLGADTRLRWLAAQGPTSDGDVLLRHSPFAVEGRILAFVLAFQSAD